MNRVQLFRITPLLAAMCVLGALVAGATVLASENAGIGGKPANPRADNPRSQSIFVYELEPGEQVEDAVEVINNTDKRKTLFVYAVDSQVSSDGAFACAQRADAPVSTGTWVDLAKTEVALAPGTSEKVPFTLTVPETASAGEHNGCVVIQDGEKSTSPENNGIVLSFRSAIRVAVTIPGDITKDLDFTGPVVARIENQTTKLTVGLKNNGNVSLDTEIEVRIRNLLGMTTRSAGGTFPVLARSEGVFNFEAEKPFWGGFYLLDARATYSSDPERSVGEAGETDTIKSPVRLVLVSPEPLALVVELLAVAAIAGLAARTLWHRNLRSKADSYKVKKGESLHAIAKKHGASWKTIAKINKLKAPYHIEPGQELKVPVSKTGSGHDKKAK